MNDICLFFIHYEGHPQRQQVKNEKNKTPLSERFRQVFCRTLEKWEEKAGFYGYACFAAAFAFNSWLAGNMITSLGAAGVGSNIGRMLLFAAILTIVGITFLEWKTLVFLKNKWLQNCRASLQNRQHEPVCVEVFSAQEFSQLMNQAALKEGLDKEDLARFWQDWHRHLALKNLNHQYAQSSLWRQRLKDYCTGS